MFQLREVIRIQKIRRRNPTDNTLFIKPLRWKDSNLNDVAEFVHNEVSEKYTNDVKLIG